MMRKYNLESDTDEPSKHEKNLSDANSVAVDLETKEKKYDFFYNIYPSNAASIKIIQFLIATVLCMLFYNWEMLYPEAPAARRALALFFFVAVLWATEAIPIYVTSMLIPILVVVMRILVDSKGVPIEAPDAADRVMGSLFSGTVMVALGAFTMSLALSKWNLSYRLAAFILRRVGKRPSIVMLTIMFLGLFLSMWVNNVASPVVVVSIVQPLLNELSSKEVYTKCLLLGIAFSNNIGGMMSPISSPQNLVASHVISSTSWKTNQGLEYTSVGWIPWLSVSLPFATICVIVCWGFLWLVYRPKLREVDAVPPKQLEPFSALHMVVLLVSMVTVGLWAINKQVEGFVGDNGIVGLIPVVVFFTLPILQKSDFKELSWDVLMLLSGGLVLGQAISSSGLLAIMANRLAELVENSNEWVVLMSFASFIWLFGNFISHTVAAIIVLPVIAQVGCHLGGGNCMAGHFKSLVLGSVFMDSGAMGLPVTSFPNAQCFSCHDKEGNRFLTVMDFVKTGFIMGVLELFFMATLGFFLLHVIIQ